MNRSWIAALCVAAGMLTAAPAADAFWTLKCDGAKVRWQSGVKAKMTRHLCTVWDSSAQASAYFSAINRWNQVQGMFDKLTAAFTILTCGFSLNDNINDFALVDTADIDGALGATFVWKDCEEIENIDMLMANLDTQNFSNPDEAFAAGTGLSSTGHVAVLHEFGHGVGLSIAGNTGLDLHVTGYAIMRGSTPLPLAGGLNQAHSRVMPDDAAGGRFLYSSGKSEVNLMASAQSLISASIFNNATWQTVNQCRGDQVFLSWTMVNGGTASATVDQRFFMVKNPSGHNDAGVTLGTWFNATVNAAPATTGVVFPSVTMKIPCGTPTGLYWLYHQVDSNKELSEWNEGDNVVHTPMTVQVNNCGC